MTTEPTMTCVFRPADALVPATGTFVDKQYNNLTCANEELGRSVLHDDNGLVSLAPDFSAIGATGDGRDDAGSLAPSGQYLVCVEAGSVRRVVGMTRMR